MVIQTQAVTGSDIPNLGERLAALEARIDELETQEVRADSITLLVFSGELDKALASLILATTAASLGKKVTVFFTFWGLNVLKEKRILEGKDFMEKMIDMMTPTGAEGMSVSQMNMLGAGAAMLKLMMKNKGVVSASELLDMARESGVRLVACSMAMHVMGILDEELVEGVEVAGAASYLDEATRSGLTLFI